MIPEGEATGVPGTGLKGHELVIKPLTQQGILTSTQVPEVNPGVQALNEGQSSCQPSLGFPVGTASLIKAPVKSVWRKAMVKRQMECWKPDGEAQKGQSLTFLLLINKITMGGTSDFSKCFTDMASAPIEAQG